MKKGQITIFVIIGLILAVLIILGFVFKDNIIKQVSKVEIAKGLTMSREARKVQSDMEGCLKEVSELGLVVLGLQGGYTILDSRVHYTDTSTTLNFIPYSGTAYSYFKGQNLVPTKEVMEKQLASFIVSDMFSCENKYKDFEVNYGEPNALVSIQEEKIKVDLEMDIKIKKDTTESGFKNVRIDLPVRLGTIQAMADKLVEKQIKTSEEDLCVSCISRIAEENDIEVDVNKINEDIFYSLTDRNSKVANYDYIFMIANKF